jgi:hypothetical protein
MVKKAIFEPLLRTTGSRTKRPLMTVMLRSAIILSFVDCYFVIAGRCLNRLRPLRLAAFSAKALTGRFARRVNDLAGTKKN